MAKTSSKVPVPADEPAEPVPSALDAALASYFEIEYLDPDAEGAPEDETQAFMVALREKADRFQVAEDAVVAAVEADPAGGTEAMVSLARMHVDMGDFIASSPLPEALTPEQSAVYADQIRLKAQVQYDKAQSVLDAAEEYAPDDARILELRASIENR